MKGLVSGMMDSMMIIKNGRPRRQKLKRVNAYCLAPIKVVGLVYTRRWKKGDRKIVGVVADSLKVI